MLEHTLKSQNLVHSILLLFPNLGKFIQTHSQEIEDIHKKMAELLRAVPQNDLDNALAPERLMWSGV